MIIRSENKDGCVQVPREIFNNPELSAKSKGVMAQLLLKPDNWKFNRQHIVDTNKEGGTAIRSAIKELEDQNYIHKFVTRKNGKIAGTEYLIFDKATPKAEAEAMLKTWFGTGGAK